MLLLKRDPTVIVRLLGDFFLLTKQLRYKVTCGAILVCPKICEIQFCSC